MIQNEAFNSIENQIEMHETNMADHYMKNDDAMNKDLVKKHLAMRDRMEDQRDLFNGIKKDFFKFLTRYM